MDNSETVFADSPLILAQWKSLPTEKAFNPCDFAQIIPIRFGDDNRTITITVPARGAAMIPKLYRRAIHRVHNGMVTGGEAPQLVYESQTYGIAPYLVTKPTPPKTPGVSPDELSKFHESGVMPDEDDYLARARKRAEP